MTSHKEHIMYTRIVVPLDGSPTAEAEPPDSIEERLRALEERVAALEERL